jgi:predicted DNA-binding transcriptional regulator AlpA
MSSLVLPGPVPKSDADSFSVFEPAESDRIVVVCQPTITLYRDAKSPKARKAKIAPEAAIGDSSWVSSVTGLSPRTIVRLSRQKQIPCLRRARPGKGVRYRFRKSEILKWLEAKH